MNNRIFSGIQPTGIVHIGNYLGALRNFVQLQEKYEDCLYCIVDMHAITAQTMPGEHLQNYVRFLAATFLACGVKPEKSILFVQSSVPEHARLAWILNCVARIGWLARMTQFKDKAGKNAQNASVGLYTYPILMAADILLYKAHIVPVGEDQLQHIELARDIAQKFNHDFSPLFTLPEPLFLEEARRIASLRDGLKKMSKSDPSPFSYISLCDDDDLIAEKIRKAKTDTLPFPQQMEDLEGRPEVRNLLNLYAALLHRPLDKIFQDGRPVLFSQFKESLIEVLIEKISPIRQRIFHLLQDASYLEKILQDGQKRAQAIAQPIYREAAQTVGFFSYETL